MIKELWIPAATGNKEGMAVGLLALLFGRFCKSGCQKRLSGLKSRMKIFWQDVLPALKSGAAIKKWFAPLFRAGIQRVEKILVGALAPRNNIYYSENLWLYIYTPAAPDSL